MSNLLGDLFSRKKTPKTSQEYLRIFEEKMQEFERSTDKSGLLGKLVKRLDLSQARVSGESTENVSTYFRLIETQIGRKLKGGERVKVEAMVHASKSTYGGSLLSGKGKLLMAHKKVVKKAPPRKTYKR